MKRFILALLASLFLAGCAHAADLTPTQRTTLHTNILADPALSALPPSSDAINTIVAAYAAPPAQACTVWRSSVLKHEVTSLPSPTGTQFDWASTGGYIARSTGERDAFNAIFNSTGAVNPSLANVQAAMADIFSGSGAGAVGNRAHFAAVSKRAANRLEKLFAAGACTSASPATMAVEGDLDYATVLQVMGW